MRVVLDCNVLLVSIPPKSPYHLIYRHIVNERIALIVSNEILLEYLEVITLKSKPQIAIDTVDMIIGNPATVKAEPYYRFYLIANDADDNKYADAAISSGADYVVTNDSHFNILKHINFPKVNVVSAEEFLKILKRKR